MGTSKSKTANTSKQLQKVNKLAVKGFPKSKVKAAMEIIGSTATAADSSQAEKSAAALTILKLAHGFRASNKNVTLETVVQGWRENASVICMELAIAKNRFAKLTPAKGEKPATAKFTDYGNNVMSYAKGCIEFEVEPLKSYGKTRALIQELRADARRSAHPELAAMQDACAELDAAWTTLRSTIVGTDLVDLVQELTEKIEGLNTAAAEQIAAQDAIEDNLEELTAPDMVTDVVAEAA